MEEDSDIIPGNCIVGEGVTIGGIKADAVFGVVEYLVVMNNIFIGKMKKVDPYLVFHDVVVGKEVITGIMMILLEIAYLPLIYLVEKWSSVDSLL